MLHYSKKSVFWSFTIFGYLSFTMVRGQKIGFNSGECIKFLNITNFHVFNVWVKRILSCNDTTFFLHYFSFFCFCNATFFHSGYAIKPPQPSSAIYGAPPYTGNLSDNLSSALAPQIPRINRTAAWYSQQCLILERVMISANTCCHKLKSKFQRRSNIEYGLWNSILQRHYDRPCQVCSSLLCVSNSIHWKTTLLWS